MVAAQDGRNVWVLPGPRQPRPTHIRMRLICFPMAGSGACMYHDWAFAEELGVEVIPVELPGTNSRMKEAKPTELVQLASDVVEGLDPFMREGEPPFALWGHSMGAWLAYEVARCLERRVEAGAAIQAPMHLFASANRAPSLTRPQDNPDGNVMHTLAADDFWRVYTQRYGANPMLESPVLRARLLPGLKADFALIETYHASSLTPLRCGLTVFGGQEDPRYSREQLEAWCSLARQDCRVHWVKGGHLFVRDQQEDVLALLTTELQTIWPV